MPTSNSHLDIFVGTWKLHSFVVFKKEDPLQKEHYPFGSDAVGRIIYATDGYMNATLSHANRTPFSVVLEQSHLASEKEKNMAFDTYMNYTGRYLIHPKSKNTGIIEHHVDMAFNPSLIGSIQKRNYERYSNGMLQLSYDWKKHTASETKTYCFQLRWEKMAT